MKRYGFAILLVIFIIGTGMIMFAREASTAKQAESFKWKHISGDSLYAENVVVQFSKYENDREVGYNLSKDEINRMPLKDIFMNTDESVEKFYKDNEDVFKPYASFFRGLPKFQKVGEHYYWDGITLAYATVKGNQANGDSSQAYLQLKVLNTKNGKITETETTLGDAIHYGPLDVFDVQVINNKLYVTTLHSFTSERNGMDLPYIFKFDVNTLEREGYEPMIQSYSKGSWGYFPFTGGNDKGSNDYYYFFGYDQGKPSSEDNAYQLLVWNYKEEKIIDLSNKLKESINRMSLFDIDRSFYVKDSLFMLSENRFGTIGDYNEKILAKIHPSGIKQVKLENSTLGPDYGAIQSTVRNGYLYLLAMKGSDKPKQGLLVYEVETGKLVYEATFPDSSILNVHSFYIK